MRGTIVVLYMTLVGVYVHRMKIVALETSHPGSACAKRNPIRISSCIFSSASAAHPCLCLVYHTWYDKRTHSPLYNNQNTEKRASYCVLFKRVIECKE
jgi:hypothetical protein